MAIFGFPKSPQECAQLEAGVGRAQPPPQAWLTSPSAARLGHSSDSILISDALQDAPNIMTVWWVTRQVPVRLRGFDSKIRIRVRIQVRVNVRCVSIRYVPHRFVSLVT